VAKTLKQTGAETIRWDLNDLFHSPTDPKLEAALAHSLERAIAFEARVQGQGRGPRANRVRRDDA